MRLERMGSRETTRDGDDNKIMLSRDSKTAFPLPAELQQRSLVKNDGNSRKAADSKP
jgi:hypothetical protein